MIKRFLWPMAILFCLVGTAQALTLKESVDFALKNNPSVLASKKKLDASRARLEQAVGAVALTKKIIKAAKRLI